MTQEQRELIVRAIGMLDGLAYVVDDKFGNALYDVSELLESTLKEDEE